ncbi:MAG: hypothetical protein OQK11_06625 [Thiovulaceae bacterium]|nr:hypothetical protein [Sulfurimonadaceae bacterium]
MFLKNRLVLAIAILLILQLYSPVLKLWETRSLFYNNQYFKVMVSKKFIAENQQNIKNKVIQDDINFILSSLNSLSKKEVTKLKNISKEEHKKLLTKNPTIYYFFNGLLYFIGTDLNSNFQQNFSLSYENFKKAKKINNSSDLQGIKEYIDISINRMLMYGIGTNANPAQAFKNYLQFKTNNADLNRYNQYIIGHSYLFGNGTKQNFKKAYEHFNNAGAYSYEMLAFMYSSGIGVDKNINQALELMNKTKNKDFNVAMIYISNNDYSKGKRHMKKCRTVNEKCQKHYHAIFKYDYYDKVLNIMSSI